MKTILMIFAISFNNGSLLNDQFSVQDIEFGSIEECEYYRKDMAREAFLEFLMTVDDDMKYYDMNIDTICMYDGELG